MAWSLSLTSAALVGHLVIASFRHVSTSQSVSRAQTGSRPDLEAGSKCKLLIDWCPLFSRFVIQIIGALVA